MGGLVCGGSGCWDGFCACRWNGVEWGGFKVLTATMPGYHWFTNIAVDSHGDAHVVWGESRSLLYYYTKSHDGLTWSAPFILNHPLLRVVGAEWPGCSIAVDSRDHPHVAWT